MAKLHLEGGVTFEGTPEEIKAYTDLYAEGGAEKAQEKPEPAQSFKEGDIVVITGNTKIRHATQAEREQYEESLKPKKPKLKADDWVKFTSYKGIVNRKDISLNKAYQVFTDTDNELAFVDDAGDRRSQPLMDKETYEIVAPPSVFERIGRKEGEFKVGDIINYTDGAGAYVHEVLLVDDDRIYFNCTAHGNEEEWAPVQYIELIAPVESRVDAN